MIRNIILDWSGTVVDDLDAVLGVRGFLGFCRQSGRQLYVLSTMHAHRFQVQMKNLGLEDYIRRSYVEVIDKQQEIKRLLDENHLSPAETAFIGDMVHDIEAAKKGGVLPIALLTGSDKLEKLEAAGSAVIVNGLRDLEKLLGVPRQDEDEVFEILDQKVTAHIGVPDEERASTQTLAITIRFRIFKRFADLEDDFARTVDYSAIASEISTFVGAAEHHLIETLVTQLADHLMAKFPLGYLELQLKKFVLPETGHVSVRTVRRI